MIYETCKWAVTINAETNSFEFKNRFDYYKVYIININININEIRNNKNEFRNKTLKIVVKINEII
jgi:hypothetical protein